MSEDDVVTRERDALWKACVLLGRERDEAADRAGRAQAQLAALWKAWNEDAEGMVPRELFDPVAAEAHDRRVQAKELRRARMWLRAMHQPESVIQHIDSVLQSLIDEREKPGT